MCSNVQMQYLSVFLGKAEFADFRSNNADAELQWCVS